MSQTGGPESGTAEMIAALSQGVEGRSLWQDARARFVRNRAAMAGLYGLAVIDAIANF